MGRMSFCHCAVTTARPQLPYIFLLYLAKHRLEHLSLPPDHNTPPFRLDVPISIAVGSWDPWNPAQQPLGPPMHYVRVDKELCGHMS